MAKSKGIRGKTEGFIPAGGDVPELDVEREDKAEVKTKVEKKEMKKEGKKVKKGRGISDPMAQIFTVRSKGDIGIGIPTVEACGFAPGMKFQCFVTGSPKQILLKVVEK